MPPSGRMARPPRSRAAAVAIAAALAVSIALVWWVVRFASQNPEEAGLGDPVFEVGQAERLAENIAEDGPFLFQDPLSRGRGRNLYIQHVGDDPDTGWVAVEARLPGDTDCAVTWDTGRDEFVDCHGDAHPADGEGLTTYPGTVTDGQVSVDLRTGAQAERRP